MVRGHLPELWVSPRYSMRHPNEEFLPTERQGYLDHPSIRTARRSSIPDRKRARENQSFSLSKGTNSACFRRRGGGIGAP